MEDKSFMVGCADIRALQTCLVIQGFPGRIQAARDHAGVQPALLAHEPVEQKAEREAGEVIICVEVLSGALQGGRGLDGWRRAAHTGLNSVDLKKTKPSC